MPPQVVFLSHAQAQRRRTGLFLTVFGCLAAGGGFVLYQITPPSEPPAPVTTADLRKLDHPGSLAHPYIAFDCKTVVGPRVVRSGRGYRNRPWKAFYYLLAVEDRWIVATSETDIRPGMIHGRIVKWDMPVNVSALQEVYSTLSPQDQAKLLPVQLNYGDYAEPPAVTGWRLLYAIAVFAGCLCLLIGLWKFAASFLNAPPAPVLAPEWSFVPPRR